MIPKGLRLNQRVNPISEIGTCEMVAKIEDILRKVEEYIESPLISHNQNLVDDTSRQLEEIERKIQTKPDNEKGAIHNWNNFYYSYSCELLNTFIYSNIYIMELLHPIFSPASNHLHIYNQCPPSLELFRISPDETQLCETGRNCLKKTYCQS